MPTSQDSMRARVLFRMSDVIEDYMRLYFRFKQMIYFI
jgi:hypothetical protein